MKKFVEIFKIPLIIFAVFLVIGIACKVITNSRPEIEFVRNNTQCTTEERVFDYADKFKELYKQNPSEVVILYPEYAIPNKDSIFQLNGNRGYSYSMDENGGLPTIGEYTLLRIMTK